MFEMISYSTGYVSNRNSDQPYLESWSYGQPHFTHEDPKLSNLHFVCVLTCLIFIQFLLSILLSRVGQVLSLSGGLKMAPVKLTIAGEAGNFLHSTEEADINESLIAWERRTNVAYTVHMQLCRCSFFMKEHKPLLHLILYFLCAFFITVYIPSTLLKTNKQKKTDTFASTAVLEKHINKNISLAPHIDLADQHCSLSFSASRPMFCCSLQPCPSKLTNDLSAIVNPPVVHLHLQCCLPGVKPAPQASIC